MSNRSLYIDEARLALNIGARNLGELGTPLDLEQIAPVPFLWAEKGVTLLFGMGEIALRVIPFLAGLALLPVLWALFRRVAGRRVALFALLLAALSPALIRASNDVKQYSVDCLVAACVLLLAAKLIREPTNRRSSLVFAAVVVASAALSLPAPIYLLPVATVVLLHAAQRSTPKYAMILFGAFAAGLVLSVIQYSTIYSVVGSSGYMQSYWQGALLRPDQPYFGARVGFAASELVWGGLTGGIASVSDQWTRVMRWAIVVVVVPLPLLGVWLIRRKQGAAMAALLIGPSLGLMAAALAGVYPASLRLWLAALPQWILLAAVALYWFVDQMTRSRPLQGVLLGLALLPSTIASIHPRLWPYLWQEVQEPIRLIRESPPSVAVYVFANSAPAWVYYTTNWSKIDRERLGWYVERIRYGGSAFENTPVWHTWSADDSRRTHEGRIEILGAPTGLYWRPYYGLARDRVPQAWVGEEVARIMDVGCADIWVLFSHYRGPENQLLSELERRGARQRSAFSRPGALLLQYQLPAPSGQLLSRDVGTSGRDRCLLERGTDAEAPI